MKVEHMIEFAQRGTNWLVSITDEKGRMGEQESINAYYKCPYPLRIMGHQATAAQVLSYVVSHFMSKEGDFYESPEKRTSGTYTRFYCNHYPNEWFLRASYACNFFGLASKIQQFLMTSFDEELGAFRSEANNTSPIVDVFSTAMGGFCCMFTGMIEPAERAGQFLIRLLNDQPDATKYYLRWLPGKGFLTEPDQAGREKFYIIDTKQGGQTYWHLGMPIVTLAKLFEITGKQEYMDNAVRYYDYLMGCHSDVLCSPPSGKLCWGSAVMYRLTKDERYRKTNSQILEYFESLLQKDGHIEPPGAAPGIAGLELAMNYTGEFSTWFADSAAEITMKG